MKFIIVFIFTLILGYLSGSFIAASFDITEWDIFLRAFIGTFVPFVATMVGASVHYD